MNSVKFMHLADVHLGKKQYNIQERYYDYFRAFNAILHKAIEQTVEFILISGDLIDSDDRVNPTVLSEIIRSIKAFQDEAKKKLNREIPLICIEGNHENPFFTEHTWLKLLADLELLILLSGRYDNKKNCITFEEYSPDVHYGGKITIKNCTIYGISYYGSATSELFPLIANAISKHDREFNILMMHFGITQYDERKTGVDVGPSLEELHRTVDYLALGHFHRQYFIPQNNPWIFNPGSIEVNDIFETSTERGVFLVELFENNKTQIRSILCENGNSTDALSISNRRFIVKNNIDISGIQSFPEAQEYILDQLKRYGVPLMSDHPLERENLDCPVIYVSIRGIIGYSQLEVDMLSLKHRITETFDILGLRLTNNLVSSMGQDIALDNELDMNEIEKQVFLGTIASEKKFEPYNNGIFQLFTDLKNQFDTTSPRYKKIANQIESWVTSDETMYSQFLQDLEQQKKAEEKSIPFKKKSKKKKEKEEKELIIKKDEEPDFSEIDYSDLLDEDEDNLDEIIDDGDLDE